MTNLLNLLDKLYTLKNSELNSRKYIFPEYWRNRLNIKNDKPIDFFIESIEKIVNSPKENYNAKSLDESIIYNLLPRYFSAFDNNGDGEISVDNKDFNELGSFLKTLCFLPYLKSLGADIIYMLPISSIGADCKKGDLGSIYAVRNPYDLDDTLSEPFLNLSVETQFKAFVEAAHHLGMKVIVEFIFRTASVDSDLAFSYPDWFYWVKTNKQGDMPDMYAPPKFSESELALIKEKVERKDFDNLPKPPKAYQNLFVKTPRKVYKENGRIFGILDDGSLCRIPGAFADWPPDDNQPVWSDVTYLKLFDNVKFNYIAYNTVRMYDNELNSPKYLQKSIVDHIVNVTPFYINEYNIDGIMLDMGHALPYCVREAIIKDSKKLNPDFIFLEENFHVTKSSKIEGFDCVVGYLPFDFHLAHKTREFIYRVIQNDLAVPSFATAENHNTPRVFSKVRDRRFSCLIWAISSFLPRSVRFIHSGFEALSETPINTGLGFSDQEIIDNPPNTLALFSAVAPEWRDDNILDEIKNINVLRESLLQKSVPDDCEIELLNTNNDQLVAFTLRTKESKSILILANYSKYPINSEIYLAKEYKMFFNSIKDCNFEVRESKLSINLDSYEYCIGEIN
jgi:glycosidase